MEMYSRGFAPPSWREVYHSALVRMGGRIALRAWYDGREQELRARDLKDDWGVPVPKHLLKYGTPEYIKRLSGFIIRRLTRRTLQGKVN